MKTKGHGYTIQIKENHTNDKGKYYSKNYITSPSFEGF